MTGGPAEEQKHVAGRDCGADRGDRQWQEYTREGESSRENATRDNSSENRCPSGTRAHGKESQSRGTGHRKPRQASEAEQGGSEGVAIPKGMGTFQGRVHALRTGRRGRGNAYGIIIAIENTIPCHTAHVQSLFLEDHCFQPLYSGSESGQVKSEESWVLDGVYCTWPNTIFSWVQVQNWECVI